MKHLLVSPLFIILIPLIVYLPIIFNPSLYLDRNNDLSNHFSPMIYFTKQQIITSGEFPLWYPYIFSGTPLVTDPQSPLFYPLNIVFLILPLNIAFIASLIFHALLASLGIYLLSKNYLKVSIKTNIAITILYLLSSKLVGLLESGHLGLINIYYWLPLLLFCFIQALYLKKILWFILVAIILSLLFLNHPLGFIYTSFALAWVSLYFLKSKGDLAKLFPYFFLTGVLTIGLSSISLLPQLDWEKNSTRFLLLETRDIYPKWSSFYEFISSFFWILNPSNLKSLDSEKWITLGLIPLSLATLGLLTLKLKARLFIVSFFLIMLLLAMSNELPFYNLLLKMDFFVLSRVLTRGWFILPLVVVLLSGVALERMNPPTTLRSRYLLSIGLRPLLENPRLYSRGFIEIKRNSYLLFYIVIMLAILEMTFLAQVRLLPPISQSDKQLSSEIVQYLKQDNSQFRVFCLDHCIRRIDSVTNNIELVEGYNTVQQTNYYKQSWQLMGGYWNYYTLAIPPWGNVLFDKLKPDPVSLGDYNVKYIISPFILSDTNFLLKKNIDGHYIYQNQLFKPRSYFSDDKVQFNAPIKVYQPNKIIIDVSSSPGNQLTLSEVYSDGWKAYLNGFQFTPVLEKPNALRAINTTSGTKFVELRYEPDAFYKGLLVTIATTASIILILLTTWIKK